MHITIEWFDGKYPQFNVGLSSAQGKEPFIVVKGCRLANGRNGEFVSWPSTKNESTGKYWNHVYASEAFAAAVLAKAQESQPKQVPRRAAAPADDDGLPPF